MICERKTFFEVNNGLHLVEHINECLKYQILINEKNVYLQCFFGFQTKVLTTLNQFLFPRTLEHL